MLSITTTVPALGEGTNKHIGGAEEAPTRPQCKCQPVLGGVLTWDVYIRHFDTPSRPSMPVFFKANTTLPNEASGVLPHSHITLQKIQST